MSERKMTPQQKIIAYTFALSVCMPVLALSAGGAVWLFRAVSS